MASTLEEFRDMLHQRWQELTDFAENLSKHAAESHHHDRDANVQFGERAKAMARTMEDEIRQLSARLNMEPEPEMSTRSGPVAAENLTSEFPSPSTTDGAERDALVKDQKVDTQKTAPGGPAVAPATKPPQPAQAPPAKPA